jgi:hypothetical protein
MLRIIPRDNLTNPPTFKSRYPTSLFQYDIRLGPRPQSVCYGPIGVLCHSAFVLRTYAYIAQKSIPGHCHSCRSYIGSQRMCGPNPLPLDLRFLQKADGLQPLGSRPTIEEKNI